MTAPYPALVEGSRVARLIAQAVEREREACAKLCEALGEQWAFDPNAPSQAQVLRRFAAQRCVKAIRARGSAA